MSRVKKSGKGALQPFIPEIDDDLTTPATPGDGEQYDLQSDGEALGLLMQHMGPKVANAYFPSLPTWSNESTRLLYGFVSYALGQHTLFKDRPLAMEEIVNKVCEAIKKSPNLSAMFMRHLDSQHS